MEIKKKSSYVLNSANSRLYLKKDFLKYSIKVSDLVQNFHNSILNKDLKTMGEIINTGWEYKKEISKKTSTYTIDNYINTALQNGAYGGKLLGAGGGGFLMFICRNKEKVLRSLNFLRMVNFKFEDIGTKIIYKS